MDAREQRRRYSAAEREAKNALIARHQAEYDGLLLDRLRTAGIEPKKLLRPSATRSAVELLRDRFEARSG